MNRYGLETAGFSRLSLARTEPSSQIAHKRLLTRIPTNNALSALLNTVTSTPAGLPTLKTGSPVTRDLKQGTEVVYGIRTMITTVERHITVLEIQHTSTLKASGKGGLLLRLVLYANTEGSLVK